ncbi:hypothetical protein SAMN05421823_102474 [Catalinimonas alkaloidigena]|uniref:Uncharacterized protein n=1 Tax=Catalinimonas alkaloidigena TaxID=1075417 RepID=A0A1G9B116_9BACT|nr:hypothetical protein [Catalinimonas alkaloidigena]SDK33276.1 hypothetical protein SAMN05421823_102474 [Catalinimonas alkaloidigena]
MQTVDATFTLSYTPEQYDRARQFVEDMKRHPDRVYWRGKEGKSDEELIIIQIVHWILSGFYNNYSPSKRRQILHMRSAS